MQGEHHHTKRRRAGAGAAFMDIRMPRLSEVCLHRRTCRDGQLHDVTRSGPHRPRLRPNTPQWVIAPRPPSPRRPYRRRRAAAPRSRHRCRRHAVPARRLWLWLRPYGGSRHGHAALARENDTDDSGRVFGWASGAPYGSRVLSMRDLIALKPQTDTRAPLREIAVKVSGDMERYIWTRNRAQLGKV